MQYYEMTIKEFQSVVADTDRPTIIDLWAPWCGPCKMMKPHFDTLGEEYADRTRVLAVNADESPQVTEELGIYSIPTVVVYRGGHEIARRKGAQSESNLRELFEAVATGNEIPVMSGTARIVRIVAAVITAVIANEVAPSWPLQAVAALLFVSAIHDRCPIIQALKRPFARSS